MSKIPLSEKNLFITLLLIIVCVCFAPVLGNSILNWDDIAMLTENPSIRSLSWGSLSELFSQQYVGTYIPLTILSFALEHALFGLQPFIYHLDNLILHMMVVVTVFLFTQRLGLPMRAAFLGALIFAIHPMHVESVAWITERKDLLYSVFYMAALLNYQSYLKNKRRKYLVYAYVLGVLSLLSKPMALSLPLIFFVMDWMVGRKINLRAVIEKIPLFAITAVIVWQTYAAYARVPESSLVSGSLVWVWCFSFYILKFLFPAVLLPIYLPPEPVSLMNVSYVLPLLIFFIFVSLLIVFRKNRWFLFAFYFQFLSMFFLLRYDYTVDLNVVGDRFMYLPSLGYCVLGGLMLNRFLEKSKGRSKQFRFAAIGALSLFFVLLGVKTFKQSNVWESDVSLWTHTLKYQPNHVYAYVNRAAAYAQRGQFELSIQDYQKAIALEPNIPKIFFSRGRMYSSKGEYGSAINDFNKAIELNNDYGKAYFARANVYQLLNNYDEAIKDYLKSAELIERKEEAYYNLAIVYDNLNDLDLAVEYYSKAISENPRNGESYLNRGFVFLKQGRLETALQDFKSALQINSRDALAANNIGVVYYQKKEFEQALKYFDKAVRLNPEYKEAIQNREALLKLTQ